MKADIENFTHQFIPGQESNTPFTLLLLHGNGGTESDLLLLGRALAPHAPLLSPRGRIIENGKPRFYRLISPADFEVTDLRVRADELASFVRTAAGVYHFDADNLVGVGHSNGANMAVALMLLHPSLLRAGILFRPQPQVPLISNPRPNFENRPILLVAGRNDVEIPSVEIEHLAELLRRSGANVTIKWHSGGHDLTNEEINLARDWLTLLPPL